MNSCMKETEASSQPHKNCFPASRPSVRYTRPSGGPPATRSSACYLPATCLLPACYLLLPAWPAPTDYITESEIQRRCVRATSNYGFVAHAARALAHSRVHPPRHRIHTPTAQEIHTHKQTSHILGAWGGVIREANCDERGRAWRPRHAPAARARSAAGSSNSAPSSSSLRSSARRRLVAARREWTNGRIERLLMIGVWSSILGAAGARVRPDGRDVQKKSRAGLSYL